ncbi:MAG: DUF427 domain-containing protein [Pseudomonadota bacterium]
MRRDAVTAVTIDLPDKSALLARAKPHRETWDRAFRPPVREPVSTGQESVWDYPRPPVLMPAPATIRVALGDIMIAETDGALEVKETAGAPVPYIPPEDVQVEWLMANGRVSVCEWKGAAVSYDLVIPAGGLLSSDSTYRSNAAPARSPSRPPNRVYSMGGRERERAEMAKGSGGAKRRWMPSEGGAALDRKVESDKRLSASPNRPQNPPDKPIHIPDVAWAYPDPFDDLTEGYAEIAGWFAFYPAKLDCFILRQAQDRRWEKAQPQPGGFYGGWVTGRIKGPIKGGPGTGGW